MSGAKHNPQVFIYHTVKVQSGIIVKYSKEEKWGQLHQHLWTREKTFYQNVLRVPSPLLGSVFYLKFLYSSIFLLSPFF